MRIIQLQLYLLVCCGAAEGSPDMLVDLGRTVTLQCEVAVKDVLWFLMKPSEPPVFILRSFSSKTLDSHYSNQTFSKTFSVQYNSSLFIHNISTNELGVYYCIQTPTGSPPKISHGIRLYIQNHSADTHQSCHISHNKTHDNPVVSCQCSNLLFISAIINCALAVIFTVFTVHHCRRSSKKHSLPQNPGFHPHQDNLSPVYDEVQCTQTNGANVQPPAVQRNNFNSTYVLLQPINP